MGQIVFWNFSQQKSTVILDIFGVKQRQKVISNAEKKDLENSDSFLEISNVWNMKILILEKKVALNDMIFMFEK